MLGPGDLQDQREHHPLAVVPHAAELTGHRPSHLLLIADMGAVLQPVVVRDHLLHGGSKTITLL